MAKFKKVIVCQEYGDFKSFELLMDHNLGLTKEDLKFLFKKKAEQLTAQVNTKDAVVYSPDHFQFQKVAGIFDLNSKIEIEICPKFLDSKDSRWKNDFFQIASITSFGKIYPDSEISGGEQKNNLFGELLARILINDFKRRIKRPIRKYNNKFTDSFEIYGYVDWDSFFTPSQDGFQQKIITYSKENNYNAVIYQAILILLDICTDPKIRSNLNYILNKISPQSSRLNDIPKKVRARDFHWNDIYQLSLKLLGGSGISYDGYSNNNMPGFLIRTDLAWEELLRKSFVYNYPGKTNKKPFFWGTTTKRNREPRNLKVNPDIVIYGENGEVKIVIDAKYKGRQHLDSKIQRSDLYEVFSFLQATDSNVGILLYPIYPESSSELIGEVSEFERCDLNGLTLIGAEVSVVGISQNGGYKKFASGIKTFIDNVLMEFNFDI